MMTPDPLLSSQSSVSEQPSGSPVVESQIGDIMRDIDELAQRGYPVNSLIQRVNEQARVAYAGQSLSELQLSSLRYHVATAHREFKISSGSLPLYLALYQVAWLLFWTLLVIPHRYLLYHWFGGGEIVDTAIISAISGSIGASIIALGQLYSHKIKLDLNESFTLWYMLKPITGAGMGAFVGFIAVILMTGIGSQGPSFTISIIIVSTFGGMNEAWALALLQKYIDKVLGANNPSIGGGVSG